MSGNDPIQGLALMGRIFKKTVKTVKKQQKKTAFRVKIWQKFLCHWMQPSTLNLIQ
jgi:hypothetical protein